MKKTFQLKKRIDKKGIREVIYLKNERKGGCPFKCKMCDIKKQCFYVSKNENKKRIISEITKIDVKGPIYKKYDRSILIYNSGNATNPEELCTENLKFLLISIENLKIKPLSVIMSTRGAFVNKKLLDFFIGLKLSYDIFFNLGVESLTDKGKEIYGKLSIQEELDKEFNLLRRYNLKNKSNFGIVYNFLFLPEFFVDNRKNNEDIIYGFVKEITTFINKYYNKGVEIRINLHPFYQTKKLKFKNAPLREFIAGAMIIQRFINGENINKFLKRKISSVDFLKNKNPLSNKQKKQTDIFIGVQDYGYETKIWKKELKKWGKHIKAINEGKCLPLFP